MKMSLSVVMSIIDKVREPLNGMASSSDHYAKKIDKIQDKQRDNSASLSMLDAYQNIRKAMDNNVLALNAEQEKLDMLRAKAESAVQPSAKLTQQIAKQSAKLAALTEEKDEYIEKLKSAGKQLKRTGVDLTRIDDEFERLTNRQKEHQKSLDDVIRRYHKLQKAAAPISKMNQALSLPTLDTAKGAVIGSAGALGSLAVFGSVVTDTAEEVRKLAQASEDTKMPVDALQALRLQAVDAGAEMEDMDAALREMNLRWGEMKSLSSGAMNDYFKDTGNRQAYEDLKNAKNTQEAYLVLMREIAAEQDDAKRGFMMDEFFGGDSEKMMKVLGGGIDGYQAAMRRLQDTGGPIDGESITSASDFSRELKTLRAILSSLKVSALTPIMRELATVMGELATNMKDMDWRDDAVNQLKTGVMSLFNAVRTFTAGLMFLGENFKGILTIIALLKIGFIALNAAMLLNPIGLIVAGISAAAVAITYLIDRFIGFDKVMAMVNSGITWLKGQFLSLVDMIPKQLIPDEWNDAFEKMRQDVNSVQDVNVQLDVVTNDETYKTVRVESENLEEINRVRQDLSTIKGTSANVGITTTDTTYQTVSVQSDSQEELDRIKNEIASIQGKSVELGVTTNEHLNKRIDTEESISTSSMPSPSMSPIGGAPLSYAPLGTQTIKSQAEVSLTIKSDKPVSVDKVKSDKFTDLHLNLGNMSPSF